MGISIHALREEGDLTIRAFWHVPDDFYPRPPRGGRLIMLPIRPTAEVISIHALREEGDLADVIVQSSPGKISIHALREEGDHLAGCRRRSFGLFLSTPSARRATPFGSSPSGRPRFLSTPSARRATPNRRMLPPQWKISIHALREEGDGFQSILFGNDGVNFYPRPPRGGRQVGLDYCDDRHPHFYPRPPRGGRRLTIRAFWHVPDDFYPRPPRGGRP